MELRMSLYRDRVEEKVCTKFPPLLKYSTRQLLQKPIYGRGGCRQTSILYSLYDAAPRGSFYEPPRQQ